MRTNYDNDPRYQEEPQARCELCKFWTYEDYLTKDDDGLMICPMCSATEAEAAKIREALC